jgi:hypothetical protein
MLLGAVAALALAATATTSATASVTAPENLVSDASGRYCAIDLSDHQKKSCFTTEKDLKAYGSTQASLPLVAVYNWIDYNQGGGYTIWYGDHACTATTSDAEYGIPDLAAYDYTTNNPSGISENNTYSSVSTYVAGLRRSRRASVS